MPAPTSPPNGATQGPASQPASQPSGCPPPPPPCGPGGVSRNGPRGRFLGRGKIVSETFRDVKLSSVVGVLGDRHRLDYLGTNTNNKNNNEDNEQGPLGA